MAKPDPSLLGIPTELRFEIYKHICTPGPVCYSFPNSPITSVSHRGPPRALLLSCHKILIEIRDFYFSLVSFRFVALSISKLDRDFISLGSLNAIRSAKKVELMLMWNWRVQKDWVVGLPPLPNSMRGWLDQHVKLLAEEGQNLKSVTLSLRDASTSEDWEIKREHLEPLQLLKGKVPFVVGEIVASDEIEDEMRSNIQNYVEELNR